MKEVFIKYNPYRQLTEIMVAGRALAENSGIRDLMRLEDEDPSQLQEWVGELPEILQEEYNDDEFEITFHGLLRDFDSLKKAFADAEGILTAELMHEPAKEPEDIAAIIDGVFQDIQSDQCPFLDLIDQEFLDTYNKINDGDLEIYVKFVDALRGKLKDQIDELINMRDSTQTEAGRIKHILCLINTLKALLENKKRNSSEEQLERIVDDITEAEIAAREIIRKCQQRVSTYTAKCRFIALSDAKAEIKRIVEFGIEQRHGFLVEMKQMIESKLNPPINQCNQWLADLPGAGDIIIKPLKLRGGSTVPGSFDTDHYMKYYTIGKGFDASRFAEVFFAPLEDFLDEQKGDVSYYFARLHRIFMKKIKPLVDLAAQKQAEQSRDYSTELSEAEQRVIELDKKIKWLNDINGKVDSILDFLN